jgi:hypothetical protein
VHPTAGYADKHQTTIYQSPWTGSHRDCRVPLLQTVKTISHVSILRALKTDWNHMNGLSSHPGSQIRIDRGCYDGSMTGVRPLGWNQEIELLASTLQVGWTRPSGLSQTRQYFLPSLSATRSSPCKATEPVPSAVMSWPSKYLRNNGGSLWSPPLFCLPDVTSLQSFKKPSPFNDICWNIVQVWSSC